MGRAEKIEVMHLKRKAILYIRQSTMRQVLINTESTIRQYALKDRLINLGWDDSMIETIDCDLGRSGTEIVCRDGFRQMMADVGEGIVGAIACIECSRLSRSSGDWGRLMEICALSDTILIDDDGIYNPNDFNDRLLLGLKGTMSEAELHFLRERMRGGTLSKAKRGELRTRLPVGYLYDEAGKVVKDPDMQVQDAINLLFESYRICGTTHRLALYYSEKGYLFPSDKNRGFGRKSDIYWDTLTPVRALIALRSPVYAGVYVFGRTQMKYTVKGKKCTKIPEESWISNIENHHESYITLEDYRMNCATLLANRTCNGATPPREGNALIQGIAFCSRCGKKMSINYNDNKKTVNWYYTCDHATKEEYHSNKQRLCVSGRTIDGAISDVILQRLTPAAVKAAEEVTLELGKRKSTEDSYYVMQVEKASYEVDLARRRYMNADPENRLVSAELERLWNEKMNGLAKAEVELRKSRELSDYGQKEIDTDRLLCLPEKLQEAWHSNTLCIKDKKRIVRCLIDYVTLNTSENEIQAGVKFKGGLIESIILSRPRKNYEIWTTNPEIVEYIREASKVKMAREIMEHLNNTGKKTGKGLSFTITTVRDLQRSYGIPSLKEYLLSKGYLSTKDKARQMGISAFILNKRRLDGKYPGICVKTTSDGNYLFAP